MAHAFPKLHNAMWPGLVGKGAELGAADRPRHDARPDRRRRGGRRQVRRRRPLPAPTRTRRSTPTTTTIKRLADKVAVARPRRRLGGGAGLAAGGRRLGDGLGRRTASASSRWSPSPAASGQRLRELGVRPYGVIRIDSAPPRRRMGEGPGRQHAAHRRDLPPGLRRRRRPRRAAGLRGRDLLGRHAFLEGDGRHARGDRPPGDPRLPGRHGAHPALRPGRQRARGAARCPRTSTGSDGAALDAALTQLTDALRPWTIDFHVAQNDGTVYGDGLPRQDRPALHGDRPERQARHPAPRRLLAARRRRRADQGLSSTSAGTAACSPTPS